MTAPRLDTAHLAAMDRRPARGPSRGGRPAKFTRKRAEQILWLVHHGFSDSYAADEVGISRATLYRWLEDPRPEYVAFREAMLDADAHKAAAITDNLIRRSRTDWRAGMAWLREHHPDRWDWQRRKPAKKAGRSQRR